MQSREQVSEELVRLQKDNDSLQGKHSLHVSLQQAEDFILPDTVEVTYFRHDQKCKQVHFLKWLYILVFVFFKQALLRYS